MKKTYRKPMLEVVMVENQPLMNLSQNNPQTNVNHENYNGEFSSNKNGFGGVWDDDED